MSGKRKRICSILSLMLIATLVLTGCGSTGGGNGDSAAYEPVTGENYLLDTICTISIYAMKSDAKPPEESSDQASETASDQSDDPVAGSDSENSDPATESGSATIDPATESGSVASDSASESESVTSDPVSESAVLPASEMQEEAEAAIDAAFEVCAEMDKTLSRTYDNSDIGRFNSAHGEWTEVSDATIELVRTGLDYSELSDGDFDITIGGVTELWDFHADPEDAKVPDADELAEAVKHVDYHNIEINGNKLRSKDPKTKIDLGGIAKGYIGDRMTEVLEQAGVVSGIINLGGNVICIGGKYTDGSGITDGAQKSGSGDTSGSTDGAQKSGSGNTSGSTDGSSDVNSSENVNESGTGDAGSSENVNESGTGDAGSSENVNESESGDTGIADYADIMSDFVIGVEAPFSDRTEIVGKVNARDKTLVTSGVYERKIEVDGKLYHHILSTETGYSVDSDLNAVTLISDKGRSVDLDALSTTCLIKGYSKANELIENTDGVEAVFILKDGTIKQTAGASFETVE